MTRLGPAVLLVALLAGRAAGGEERPPPPPASPSASPPLRLDPDAVRTFERSRGAPGKAPTRTVVLERRETPVGIDGAGPARQGDQRSGTSAFVLEDDRVLVVRDGRCRTLGGASAAPPVRARRVAVLADGTVVVQDRTGRLYVAGEGGVEPLGLRAQAQAQVVADRVRPVAWLGTEAGAVLRLDPVARTLDTVWESGDAPVSALAAEDGRLLVGRGDGSLETGARGGPRSVVARFATSVRAVALVGPWMAAEGGGLLFVLRETPERVAVVHAADADGGGLLAFLPRSEGPPLVATCAAADPRGGTHRLLVRSLDADLAGASIDLDLPPPPPGGAGRAPWSVPDVRSLLAGPDGGSIRLVVPQEGAERVVLVRERPLGSGGGR